MGLLPGVPASQKATEAQVDEEQSRLITQVTNEINWHMRERNLSRADLASRMGVSPGRVSQVLSGGENLTLRTLATLATALGTQFDLTLSAREPVVEESAVEETVVEETRAAAAEDRGPLAWAERFEGASSSRTRA
jgi:transcriptional regulator with XRE-family HTH domain